MFRILELVTGLLGDIAAQPDLARVAGGETIKGKISVSIHLS